MNIYVVLTIIGIFLEVPIQCILYLVLG